MFSDPMYPRNNFQTAEIQLRACTCVCVHRGGRRGRAKERKFFMSAQENQPEENRWFKNKLMSSYFDLL